MEELRVVPEANKGAAGEEVLFGWVPSPSQQGKEAEHRVWHDLTDQGYAVYKTGWPDFICGRELNGVNHIMVVEVKTGGATLTVEQGAVARLLVRAGIAYWVQRPDTGEQERFVCQGPLIEKVCPCCGHPQ